MSNDTKFWIARFGFIGCLAIAVSILMWALGEVQKVGNGEPGHPVVGFTLFFAVIILSMPVAFVYHYYKLRRWNGVERKSFSQTEVETLAALAAAEKKAKDSKPQS